MDIRRTIAIIGQTLVSLCVPAVPARRLRRHNVLYRSTIGPASGILHRPKTIDVRRAIPIKGQLR